MKIVILGSGLVQFEAIEYLFNQDIEVHILSNIKPQFKQKYFKHFENIDILPGNVSNNVEYNTWSVKKTLGKSHC